MWFDKVGFWVADVIFNMAADVLGLVSLLGGATYGKSCGFQVRKNKNKFILVFCKKNEIIQHDK